MCRIHYKFLPVLFFTGALKLIWFTLVLPARKSLVTLYLPLKVSIQAKI